MATRTENMLHSYAKLGRNRSGKGRTKRKAVYQYSPDGKLIAEYKSGISAARANGYVHSMIRMACIGECKGYKGYFWSYVKIKI
jgi:hypothetical protein